MEVSTESCGIPWSTPIFTESSPNNLKIFRKDNSLYYVSIKTLPNGLSTPFVSDLIKFLYQRFHNCLSYHNLQLSNPTSSNTPVNSNWASSANVTHIILLECDPIFPFSHMNWSLLLLLGISKCFNIHT